MFFRTTLHTVVLCAAFISAANAVEEPTFYAWSAKPAMGWNSWDCFATTVTETQVRAHADILHDKLARYGWNILTVDIQWYEPNATGFDYRQNAKLAMDEWGRLIPATTKFPSAANGAGFKALADHIHSRGLRFGLHLMRGIPRQAVMAKTPVKGTHFTADQIADVASKCFWNGDMYGVDMSKPGAQEYYNSVFELFAEWGLDFVKVDDLSVPYHLPEIEAIRRAIDRTGRPIVLSTSPGPTPLASGPHVETHANMWRISGDFWDEWPQLYSQFNRLRDWTPFRGPGHFPDADMLPLGTISMGKRQTNFTPDEQITLLTLWSIARSPLILGADLTQLDESTLALITNSEVIGVDQDSADNRELFERDGFRGWVANIPGTHDRYLALFNTRPLPGHIDPTRAIFRSEPITRRTPGQGVKIDLALNGAKKLFLVIDDTRDSDGGDDAVWAEPSLVGKTGSTPLTALHWVTASSGHKTTVAKANSASGKVMIVGGKPVSFGIAAHAHSVIEYNLPAGTERFQAFAGIDDGGQPPPSGPWPGPTVQFLVFTDAPFATEDAAPVSVNWFELDEQGPVQVRDLWAHKDLGLVVKGFAPLIKAHSAGLYRLSPSP